LSRVGFAGTQPEVLAQRLRSQLDSERVATKPMCPHHCSSVVYNSCSERRRCERVELTAIVVTVEHCVVAVCNEFICERALRATRYQAEEQHGASELDALTNAPRVDRMRSKRGGAHAG
jgi:hypothetical protein